MILDMPKTIERRKSPRYHLGLSVDIVLEGGNILTVNTSNVSSNGLQISCDSWIANEIEPRGIQSHNVSQLRFKVIGDLKLDDSLQKFYANSRIMSVHRVSQDKYLLSIAFIDFENGTQSVLSEFIDQHKTINVIHKGVVGE